jgi:hypothetical protein
MIAIPGDRKYVLDIWKHQQKTKVVFPDVAFDVFNAYSQGNDSVIFLSCSLTFFFQFSNNSRKKKVFGRIKICISMFLENHIENDSSVPNSII